MRPTHMSTYCSVENCHADYWCSYHRCAKHHRDICPDHYSPKPLPKNWRERMRNAS